MAQPVRSLAAIPVRGRLTALLSTFVAAAAMVAVGCAPGNTTEVGSSPDGYPAQAPDGYPSPQVMAEVTLPDGSVSTLPQPSVPVITTPAPDAGPPADRSAPEQSPAAPADGRAVERLDGDAEVDLAGLALTRIPVDWRAALPGWQIRFLPARAGLRGATFPDRRVIEIYVRRRDSAAELAHVVAHELGHAVDVSRLDDADRAAWKAARGIDPRAAWFPAGSAVADFTSPAGDWAESFARWQTGTGWYSKLGPPPDVAQAVLLAQLSGLA